MRNNRDGLEAMRRSEGSNGATAQECGNVEASPAALGSSNTFDVTSMREPLALRAKEAANALGLSERSLWSLTNRGEIPHVKVGRRVVYPVEQVRAWLAERAKRSTRRGTNRTNTER